MLTTRRSSLDTGFTLLETLMMIAAASIIAATAVASITGAMRQFSLNTGIQTVAAQVGAARYEAVAKNRRMRVRFDCPGPNQMRIVELVNDPAIDNDADRCSEDAYPFPDLDPGNLPDADGPVVLLPSGIQFGGFQDLEIGNTGRVTPLTGCPACAAAPPPAAINVSNGYDTQVITVSASGQVLLP